MNRLIILTEVENDDKLVLDIDDIKNKYNGIRMADNKR